MKESDRTTATTTTMPKFSRDNPLQSIYLKKKGVERLLRKNEEGGTISTEFVDETRKRIEEQQYNSIIAPSGFSNTGITMNTSNSSSDMAMPTVHESNEIMEERQDIETATTVTQLGTTAIFPSVVPVSLSITSSLSSTIMSLSRSWSLPGLDDEEKEDIIDPKFLNINHDEDRQIKRLQAWEIKKRQQHNNSSNDSQQSSCSGGGDAGSVDTFDLIFKHATCHQEDRVTFKDWARCF